MIQLKIHIIYNWYYNYALNRSIVYKTTNLTQIGDELIRKKSWNYNNSKICTNNRCKKF